jgi:hypothetical protein
MPRSTLAPTTLFLIAASLAAAQQVEFRPHVIEDNMPGGYSVLVTDLNQDGRPDVIGLTSRITELAWYENPGWQRHVLVKDMTGLVNMAAADIDGDGIPELAVESGFSMVAAQSEGLVWLLRHQGDPREPWKATKIDALTTSHHIAWADVDGDGKKELINAPLIGPRAVAPKYEDHVPLVFYRVPADLTGPWKRRLIDDQIYGVLHRVRVVHWNRGRREQLLTASFDGITLHEASGKGDNLRWENKLLSRGHQEAAPRAGTSDVKVGRLAKRRFLAAVEPWHGNEVVMYREDKNGRWRRQVLYSDLIEGHEVCVGDFNGDGRDEIVAGDRAKGKIASAHIFYARDDAGAAWDHQVLDENGMSASGCQVADINGDGKPDIILIGGATHNLKWYENRGPAGRQSGPDSHSADKK